MSPAGAAPFHAGVASAREGVEAAWITAADGVRLRVVTWAGPPDPRGTAVIFPGRTEFAEKYGRLAGELATLGLAAAAIDWRGQGLSDRDSQRPMLGHVGDFAEFQRDADAFLAHLEARAMPRPWILVAQSMGGGIGLRRLQDQGGFEAAVFSAPMWRLHIRTITREASNIAFRLAHLLGQGARLTPGAKPVPTPTLGFEKNALTSDRESFDLALAQITAHPELALGGPSMQWTRAAFDEMARIQRRPLPDIPMLVFLGSDETVVAPAMIRRRVAGVASVRLVDLPAARHEVFMEAPPIRRQVLREIDALLDRIGAGPAPRQGGAPDQAAGASGTRER